MTQVIFDSSTLAKFGGLHDPVEVCDESGRLVGFFRPALPASELKRMASESAFSEEELQTIWNQDRLGRPLTDILRGLRAS